MDIPVGPAQIPATVEVICGTLRGTYDVAKTKILYLSHLGGIREATPTEFERLGGRQATKKWKQSIRVVDSQGQAGKSLGEWLAGTAGTAGDGQRHAFAWLTLGQRAAAPGTDAAEGARGGSQVRSSQAREAAQSQLLDFLHGRIDAPATAAIGVDFGPVSLGTLTFDLRRLFSAVGELGGYAATRASKDGWEKVVSSLGLRSADGGRPSPHAAHACRAVYEQYLLRAERLEKAREAVGVLPPPLQPPQPAALPPVQPAARRPASSPSNSGRSLPAGGVGSGPMGHYQLSSHQHSVDRAHSGAGPKGHQGAGPSRDAGGGGGRSRGPPPPTQWGSHGSGRGDRGGGDRGGGGYDRRLDEPRQAIDVSGMLTGPGWGASGRGGAVGLDLGHRGGGGGGYEPAIRGGGGGGGGLETGSGSRGGVGGLYDGNLRGGGSSAYDAARGGGGSFDGGSRRGGGGSSISNYDLGPHSLGDERDRQEPGEDDDGGGRDYIGRSRGDGDVGGGRYRTATDPLLERRLLNLEALLQGSRAAAQHRQQQHYDDVPQYEQRSSLLPHDIGDDHLFLAAGLPLGVGSAGGGGGGSGRLEGNVATLPLLQIDGGGLAQLARQQQLQYGGGGAALPRRLQLQLAGDGRLQAGGEPMLVTVAGGGGGLGGRAMALSQQLGGGDTLSLAASASGGGGLISLTGGSLSGARVLPVSLGRGGGGNGGGAAVALDALHPGWRSRNGAGGGGGAGGAGGGGAMLQLQGGRAAALLGLQAGDLAEALAVDDPVISNLLSEYFGAGGMPATLVRTPSGNLGIGLPSGGGGGGGAGGGGGYKRGAGDGGMDGGGGGMPKRQALQ